MSSNKEKTYFRTGLGLRKEINEIIDKEFTDNIIEYMKANDFQLQLGSLGFYLAKEFGFCYGVERAINYSYQIFQKFPDKRVFITGEVIHNPFVNKRLLEMGVRFLSGQFQQQNKKEDIQPEDVVILPAFGVPVKDLQSFLDIGCTIVDTTCGSVIVVWKNVEKYAKNGFTSLVHGKWYHEETRATCSQADKYENGHYLVILNMKEAQMVSDFIMGKMSKDIFCDHFKDCISEGFDPDIHLQKVGMANQTTMLMTETQEIGDFMRGVFEEKYGAENIDAHFKAMDTICSATQERQDALKDMIEAQNPDIFLVVGGFNSSNTANLANICRQTGKPAYHIRGPEDIHEDGSLSFVPGLKKPIQKEKKWLQGHKVRIGITAGASTPNSVIGQVIEKITALQGLEDQLKKIVDID